MHRFGVGMLAAVILAGMGIIFSPPRMDFPFLAKPESGVLEWTDVSPTYGGFVFSMGLVGRERPLIYDCHAGRNGDCIPFNSLREMADVAPPLEVRYVAMGDELVMLTVDGRQIIRLWLEQIQRVWLPLVWPMLALCIAIGAIRRLVTEDRLSEAST